MVLKCNICSFNAAEKISARRGKVEENIRKHIRDEHADMLPKSTYDQGKFFRKNIIYEKDRFIKSLFIEKIIWIFYFISFA